MSSASIVAAASSCITPTASLKGLRVYMAVPSSPPVEVMPPAGPRKYWTRRGVAEWLVERLTEAWPAFFDDFQQHWPTDDDNTYVDVVRGGACGNGAARAGNSRWRRLTEERAGGAKSVFHFDVQGSVGNPLVSLFMARHHGGRGAGTIKLSQPGPRLAAYSA